MKVDEFKNFIRSPENDNRHLELIDGEIVELNATALHGYWVARVAGLIGNPSIGWGMIKVGCYVPNDDLNFRCPDFAFLLKKEGRKISDDYLQELPEFVVEVAVSDENASKTDFYLKNGTQLVWVIYPEKQLVEVITPQNHQLLIINDILDGGNVVPTLRLPMWELFAESGQ